MADEEKKYSKELEITPHNAWAQAFWDHLLPIKNRVSQHPLFAGMASGELSVDCFRYALLNFYPLVAHFPSFMAMNLARHGDSLTDMYRERLKGDPEKAHAVRTFYEEYFATMDLTAEFYLETVETIFQQHALPLGQLKVFGTTVDPSAIRRTALLTVEGEKDDICAVGQTLAAQDMCSRLRPYMKTHHVQTGVGHYGVFNGRRWEQQIYPRVRALIYESDASSIPAQVMARPATGLREYMLSSR